MIKLTPFAIPLAATLVRISFPLQAAEYYNQRWFDYPDIGTAPRVTIGCAHEACTDIPEFHGFKVEMHSHCVCTNPTQKTELLRKDVRVVVSGPDTSDQAVKECARGICGRMCSHGDSGFNRRPPSRCISGWLLRRVQGMCSSNICVRSSRQSLKSI
jgi:hypothetical protein